MLEIQAADAELTLTLEGLLRAANNLTTAKEGYALDARQGKALDEKKLDRAQVLDHLNAETPGCALDARQGRWLLENKLGFADVVNDLETNEPSKPLSAAQGAALGSSVAALAHTVEALSSALAQKPDLSSVYQVGDIHITTSTASPASIYGGTWEQLKDRFLLAAGNAYAAGSTGGEATHTLSKAELANHDHTLRQEYPASGTATFTQWQTYFKLYSQNSPALIEPWEADFSTKGFNYSSGGIRGTEVGQPHNNMPPYLTVYMWRRIA